MFLSFSIYDSKKKNYNISLWIWVSYFSYTINTVCWSVKFSTHKHNDGQCCWLDNCPESTLQQEAKQQKVTADDGGCSQNAVCATGTTAALRGFSKKSWFKNWGVLGRDNRDSEWVDWGCCHCNQVSGQQTRNARCLKFSVKFLNFNYLGYHCFICILVLLVLYATV